MFLKRKNGFKKEGEKQEMRDSKGRFMKGNKGYNYRNPKTGRYIKKTEIIYREDYSSIPEYTFNPATQEREKITYRACVTLNGVPEHSEKYRGGKEHYLNFSYVKVAFYEDINIEKMKEKLMEGIAKYFHCKVGDLIYDSDGMEGIGDYWKSYSCMFDIEFPKPYRGSFFEGMEEGHVHIW